LCQSHADAVFGLEDPPWKRLDAKSQREIVDEWLRAITILAHGGHRPPGELLAEIASVNEAGTEMVRLMSPLMPGEARDLQETQRAVNRLRGREAMVHAAVTQILLDWYATATGQTHDQAIQRLALTLSEMFEGQGTFLAGPARGERALPLAMAEAASAWACRRAGGARSQQGQPVRCSSPGVGPR
jgi:hypothetical protein